MPSTPGAAAVVAVALACTTVAAALSVTVADRDVERALKLAQSTPDSRARFHASYILSPNDATLERLEVITEYRRYVLTTEEQLRLGHWMFAQTIKDAQELLRPWRGRLSMTARLRFHPQNTFNAVPPYELFIGNPDVAALDVVRTPITAVHSGNRRDLFAPILGATVDAVFDAAAVAQTTRPVRLSLAGQEIVRVSLDFGRLE